MTDKSQDNDSEQILPKALLAVKTKVDLVLSPNAVEDVRAKVEAKEKENKVVEEVKNAMNRMKEAQLSLFDIAPWQNHMRAIPNDYARSALFTVRNKRTPRAARDLHTIYHVNNECKITYSGIELRADDDELVWVQIMEYAKRVKIGSPVTFSFYELCKDLGWQANGRYYDKAHSSLSRLNATSLQFSSSRVGRLDALSLINKFTLIDKGKQKLCSVVIEPQIVMLFAGDHYTKFEWDRYRKLSPTARRMFDYFSTHREPFPLKLATFKLICGSDSSRESKWKEQCKIAAAELEKTGLIQKIWVENQLIHCKR